MAECKNNQRYSSTLNAPCIFFLLSLLLVSGCQSPPPAPIQYRTPPPSEKINFHVVSRGETLAAIAWRYELDTDALARANGLVDGDHLYDGQRLTLDTSRTATPIHKRSPSSEVAKAYPAQGGAVHQRPQWPSPPSTAKKPKAVAKSAGDVKTGQVTKSKPQWRNPTVVTKKTVSQSSKASGSSRAAAGGWQWPTEGKVIRRFNAKQLFKGIDIEGRYKQSIYATRGGIVAYAGNGLRGYGNLIIIKHNKTYLSAYGHCRVINVKEGQRVGAGQKIADVGGDPANQRRLYFEIRRNGSPVNPLQHLPK